MVTTFEAGTTVYDEQGQQAEYVVQSGDGHIVRPIVEGYDHYSEGCYEHVCDPVVWRHVFIKPPVAKYSEELGALHAHIAAAKKERDDAARGDYDRARERAAKLKRFAILDNVELFIDGKISHYVESDASYSPPTITSVEAEKSGDSDNWKQTLRLLTLGGDLKNGTIHWTLNHYSDGSGSGKGVIPCTSLEQAQEIQRTAVAKHFADKSSNRRESQSWIDAADKLGIDVPDAYRRAVAEARLKNMESNMASHRRQADQYAETARKSEAEVADLRAFLASPAVAQ